MRKLMFPVVVAVALSFLFVGSAQADSFTLTDCGTSGTNCPGATYTFTVTGTTATLSIKIGGGNALTSSNDIITGVDLGFVPQNAFATFNTTVATDFNGTLGTSFGSLGSLNNANCGSNGGAFVCGLGPTPTLISGETYSWTWSYTLTSHGLTDLSRLTDSGVHVGANYGPANGLIVSCSGTGVCAPPSSVPEPSSLVLLVGGLLGAALLTGVKALK
jgi:hypothetical protein